MTRKTRPISWIRAALMIAAEGGRADFAALMRALGAGAFEIALA
jgi:hypothetical protein